MSVKDRLGSPILLVIAAVVSVQAGAILAKQTFDIVPPVSVAWLRLTIGALILAPFVRLKGKNWGTWPTLFCYGASLTLMNWSIYESFSRLPVGIAVTIEFLGPLTIGVIFQRRRIDLLFAAIALLGVALLGVRPAQLDWVGIGFAVLAGAGWGSYIHFGQALGKAGWTGATPVCLAAAFGSIALAVPAFSRGGDGFSNPNLYVWGLAIALLSTVFPYTLELQALRTVPASVFGILMSLDPAVAALFAWTILGESLSPTDVLAIFCVVLASIGVVGRGRRADKKSPSECVD